MKLQLSENHQGLSCRIVHGSAHSNTLKADIVMEMD